MFEKIGLNRYLTSIGLIILVLAIPLTVKLAQTSQEIRNLAMEAYPSPSPEATATSAPTCDGKTSGTMEGNASGGWNQCSGGNWVSYSCPDGQTFRNGECVTPTIPMTPAPTPASPSCGPYETEAGGKCIDTTTGDWYYLPNQSEQIKDKPNLYIPALNKNVKVFNNSVYDALTGNLLGPLSDYADYFYLQNTKPAYEPFRPTYIYDTITPNTFNNPLYQKLRDVGDAALLDASKGYEIQAITSAFHSFIPYDPVEIAFLDQINIAKQAVALSPSDKTATVLQEVGSKAQIYYEQYHTTGTSLEDKLAQNQMVCIDMAIAENAYLASRGIDSQIVLNFGMGHAYLTTTINDQQYIADPQTGLVMTPNQYKQSVANFSSDKTGYLTPYLTPLGTLQR